MQVNPYLTFDGRCEEAFKAYGEIRFGTPWMVNCEKAA